MSAQPPLHARPPAGTRFRIGRRRAAGQALVEFALVVPIFFLLVFGIIDGGRAIFSYNQMSQAARAVVRVASVTCFQTTPRCDGSTAGTPIQDAIAAQSVGQQAPVTWTVQCIDPSTDAVATTCAPGDIVRVTATSQFTLATPLIAQAMGPFTLTSTSEADIIQ